MIMNDMVEIALAKRNEIMRNKRLVVRLDADAELQRVYLYVCDKHTDGRIDSPAKTISFKLIGQVILEGWHYNL